MTAKPLTAPLVPMDLEEAEDTRRVEDPYAFDQAVLSEGEFRGIKLPERRYIINGLIAEESITIINGYRGQGKSFLAMALSMACTRMGGKIGLWDVIRPVNVLLIDGEMPVNMLQDRLVEMGKEQVGVRSKELYIYPEGFAYRIGLHRANILDTVWRQTVLDLIVEKEIGLVVLDNLSSLAPGIDENNKLEFDPVNRWLLEIRYSGTSIIMTHHTGKSGEQRGTSAHEDHVDLSLLLLRPKGYRTEMGCRFVIEPTKDRAHVLAGKSYMLQLMEGEKGGLELAVVGADGERMSQADLAIQENPHLTLEGAMALGISRATYFRARKRATVGLVPEKEIGDG